MFGIVLLFLVPLVFLAAGVTAGWLGAARRHHRLLFWSGALLVAYSVIFVAVSVTVVLTAPLGFAIFGVGIGSMMRRRLASRP